MTRHDLLPTAAFFAWTLGALLPVPAAGQPPGEAQVITGVERLTWTQQAFDDEELRRHAFVLYVDGAPVLLPAASCGAIPVVGQAASCESPLPELAPGFHDLELAARLASEGAVLESPRSAPLRVFVDRALPYLPSAEDEPEYQRPARRPVPAGAAVAGPRRPAAATAELVVSGLDDPAALALLPDGRLLIAERRGWLRLAAGGRLAEAPAAVLADADPAGRDSWSLALAPDAARTREVFLGYAARDASGARVGRVIRFREAGGTLGEAAVVHDGLPADPAAPLARFGPDGALYVATSALDPRDAGDLGSYAGKLLRFNPDGTAAEGNPIRHSPVLSSGYRARPDFDWNPADGLLWSVEPDPGGALARRVEALGGPAAGSVAGAPGRPDRGALVRLDGLLPGSAAFARAAGPASWRGSLFLAAPDQGCLVRVSGLGQSPPAPAAVERLFCGLFGRITAVLAADDGLYFAAVGGGRDEAGRPTGAIYRVRGR